MRMQESLIPSLQASSKQHSSVPAAAAAAKKKNYNNTMLRYVGIKFAASPIVRAASDRSCSRHRRRRE